MNHGDKMSDWPAQPQLVNAYVGLRADGLPIDAINTLMELLFTVAGVTHETSWSDALRALEDVGVSFQTDGALDLLHYALDRRNRCAMNGRREERHG